VIAGAMATDFEETPEGQEPMAATTEEHANDGKVAMEKSEYVQKARDAGWTETTAFDYDQFTRSGGNDTEWHGAARVYEWLDDFGDVAPEVPELERILFGGDFQMRKGDHYGTIGTIPVTVEGPAPIEPVLKVPEPDFLQDDSLLISLPVRGDGPAPRNARQHRQMRLRLRDAHSALRDPGGAPG